MGLAELARRWVDPRPRFSADEFRRSRPLRGPNVEETRHPDGTVVLSAPLADIGRGALGWMARRMNTPTRKTFELEPVGAFVWSLCDGRNTFDTISKKLRAEYKMNRMEADAALAAFLQMLARRGLITGSEVRG